MTSRRDFLTVASLAAGGLALSPLVACSQDAPRPPDGGAAPPPPAAPAPGSLATRPIPRTGESLPVIGMGTSGSLDVGDDMAAREPLQEALRLFVASGATLIDTAPTYGSSEPVLGDLVAAADARGKLFLATKLSGVTGRDEGLAQFNGSLRDLHTDKVELLQVHNLRDTDTQFALIEELKQQGKVRYSGLTHYQEHAQAELAAAMRRLKPDFVQINYSPVSRGAEREVLPLAQELGTAVIINRAFEDGRLFAQVKGRPLPDWAAEAGADSWAQLFLKFVLAHPAVNVVIPATSKPRHQADNLKAGVGPFLDETQRAALVALLS
ncbi:aldo/keto reductase [Marilutibacter chinensis]|uniref:Aldo/keto reductase n=1 Tax=Marilutibacter chinensis TaxID=2912247 RepID=A0ABS9HY23_9GAMM|nr:aldo/keto reductase [Lysobacter chinensis]MCF7221207.1 aldo/keto reductase [Lysobacter chinensis]MCF7223052.1 aldo/keto reductase [Lysobacter chinensis]